MECEPLCLYPVREMQLRVQHSSWEPWPQHEPPVTILWEAAWSQQQPLKWGYKAALLRQDCQKPLPIHGAFLSSGKMDNFISEFSRGGRCPLQPRNLLSLYQLCPLHSVFTSFKQINLNTQQMSWRWYLGECFRSCFASFPLSSEVKT